MSFVRSLETNQSYQGVSGCGKSTLGMALASALSVPFLDADDLHPPANVAKMSAGTPLTDADRAPWLVKVRDAAQNAVKEIDQGESTTGRGVVVACSALKKSYRDVLRGERITLSEETQDHTEALPVARQSEDSRGKVDPSSALPDLRTFFVYPSGPRDVLLSRMHGRQGHFMKADMLDSQLSTLEDPLDTGEDAVVRVSVEDETGMQLREAVDALRNFGITSAQSPGVKLRR